MTPIPKVLFILGWARSGSTLLDNVLGQVEGFFSAGELRWLWERVLEDRRCSCGEPLGTCPLWSTVLAQEFGYPLDDPALCERVVTWQRRSLRVRHFLSALRAKHGQPSKNPDIDAYKDVMERLYRGIAEVTGDRVIVDSSKMPPDAALLQTLTGVSAYFVHLVRDPRAVTYSWQRRKINPDLNKPAEMMRRGTIDSTLRWTTWNMASELIRKRQPQGRAMILRYEDFVSRPRDSVKAIVRMLGEDASELPFVDDQTAVLGGNHMAAGNPNRYRTGLVPLRFDDQWRRDLADRDRVLTTVFAAPLLSHYGYPVGTKAAGRRGR